MNDDANPGYAGLPPTPLPPPEGAERRAAGLLVLLLVLLLASGFYLMYARGVFEPTQRLVLVADDSEGVVVGMNLTFSGFAIGRVRRIELAPDGNARIIVDVPRADAHWLRTSSVFTLSRGLVGNTAIRAYSGILADPPLPDGAERKVLVGDATAEIPQLVSAAREMVKNLTALSASDAALAATLANAQALTGKLNGPGGVVGALTGNPQDAARLAAALEQAHRLMARVDGLVARTDGLLGRADAQLFGQQGMAVDAQASLRQLNALLGEARGSLKKVDGLLDEAQGVARNARVATTDLGQLRAEVDASLRKVEQLVNEVNRKWPFARDTEIKLP
jgi:phospholipid/cholesterol/gamma-HCH transport system substrate-binding protein